MNRLLTMALSAILCMGLLAVFFGKTAQNVPQNAPLAASSDASDHKALAVSDTGDGTTVLERNSAGQFHIDGRINGNSLPFLIDTGADAVVLSQESATEAGLFFDTTQFQPIMQTANGTGRGVRVPVSELEVAGKKFENLDVVVMEDLHVNLLGQSVLRQLGRIELSGDRMVIERN